MSQDEEWLHAGALALRLHHRDHGDDEPIKSLRERLSNLNAEDNARLFWVVDALLQSLYEVKDPWRRLAEVTIHDGPVQLRPDRDLTWLSEALGDTNRDTGERAMLLEAAIRLSPDHDTWKEHVEGLRPLIADEPSFAQRLDDWLKPSKHDKEHRRWEKKQAERKKQEERRKAKNRASWIQFWREVANQPENAFSTEQSWNTAWNLWRAMSHDGDDSRSSGWNRRFIEEQFNQETADKLRRVLMKIWRDDHPTFPSERPESERNTFLVRWQLGLAAIYAEADAPTRRNKAGEFYTPRSVVRMMVEILDPQEGESIYDPACGTGGMLLGAIEHVMRKGGDPRTFYGKIYGQEKNLTTSAIARMNLVLHGIEDFLVAREDTLRSPAFTDSSTGGTATFDCVIANPPFSLKEWGRELWEADPWGRAKYGIPPESYGDYAFVQHMIASMAQTGNGRMAVVLPQGALFRKSAEGNRDFVVEPGDVLINLTAQSLEDGFMGRVCLVRDNDQGLLNQRIGRFRRYSELLLPEYLFRVLQTSFFQRFAMSMCEGSKIKHLFWQHIEQFEFPLPSKTQQVTIVQKLRVIDNSIANVEVRRRSAADLQQQILQAVMRNMQAETNDL